LQIIKEVDAKHGGKIPIGTKWFIPADNSINSHETMSAILQGRKFAVFVVNGNGITLTFPYIYGIYRQPIEVKKTKELHEHLREMYREYELERVPVAITGYLCIGRGISISQPKTDEFDAFLLDYGVLSNCSKKAEASQNAGRTKGNYKHWEGYKPPVVFCTKKFSDVATECEKRSRELAKIAFSRDAEDPSVITNHEFKGITKNGSHEIDHFVFADDVMARRWAADPNIGLNKKMSKSGPTAPETLLQVDGENPTLESVLTRRWGLNDKSWIRKIRLDTNEICLYWKKGPSFPSTYVKPS